MTIFLYRNSQTCRIPEDTPFQKVAGYEKVCGWPSNRGYLCLLYKRSILHILRSSLICCRSSFRRWVSFGWRLLNCCWTSCIRSVSEIFLYSSQTLSIRSRSLWSARNSSSPCQFTSWSKGGLFVLVLVFVLFYCMFYVFIKCSYF